MMMENTKLKLRFPRAFFSSCKTRTLVSDVIIQQQYHEPVAEFYNSLNSDSPPLIPFSSNSIDALLPHQYSPIRRRNRFRYSYPSRSCKPRCPETLVRENCILSIDRRRKIFPSATAAAAEKRTPPPSDSLFYSPVNDVVCGGRRCPPVSPASPFGRNYYYSRLEKVEKQSYTEKKSRRRKTNRKTRKYSSNGNSKEELHCNNVNVTSSYDDKSSSDDEREEVEDNDVNYNDSDSRTGTFLSSTTKTSFLSLSSSSSSSTSSSDSTRIHNRGFRNKSEYRRRRRGRRDHQRRKEGGSVGKEEEKVVKGSAAGADGTTAFAVVKRSNDPYSDFRDSMIEMIVEKQMFRKKELELLLDCFLSLNSYHHHPAIVEVFLEIWDALFST